MTGLLLLLLLAICIVLLRGLIKYVMPFLICIVLTHSLMVQIFFSIAHSKTKANTVNKFLGFRIFCVLYILLGCCEIRCQYQCSWLYYRSSAMLLPTCDNSLLT